MAWSGLRAALVVALASVLGGYLAREQLVLSLGRFFRDVARSKARRRLYGNEYALVSMMMGQDEPITGTSDETQETVTVEELASATGQDGAPLWLSIKGRVYDVSQSPHMYGEGRSYHVFVGRDATRAFGLGCKQPHCLSPSIEGLTEKQLKDIDRWIELYETHDKYTFVGHLQDVSPIDAILADE